MQGGAADHRSGQRHRLKLGHRRQNPGAADLDGDGVEPGFGSLGGILVGHRPAWRLRCPAYGLAQGEIIQLDHRTIGLVGELRPQPVKLLHRRPQFGKTANRPGPVVGAQAADAEIVQQLALRGGRHARRLAAGIEDRLERPLGNDPGIKLLERAGGGIAGIGKGVLAGGAAAGVEGFKAFAAHEDLAARLEDRWRFPHG